MRGGTIALALALASALAFSTARADEPPVYLPPAYAPPMYAPPDQLLRDAAALEARGRAKKSAAVPLLILGPIGVVGGLALFSVGYAHVLDASLPFSTRTASSSDWAMLFGGLALDVVGLGLLGAGIAMYVVGGAQVSKAERMRAGPTFAPMVAPGAAGMQLRFSF